ncbi:hypothetical protein BJV78DRAFT_1152847 [Lactifluus subvellereus]|nr:hypothetical protein BJV78DRAFT_1152847 [Lactifluus subvellereus]
MEATYEVPKLPSSQLKIVLLYLDLIKVFNLEEVEKLFMDDFVQSTAPSSLHVPSRTKEEDLAFLKGLSETLEGRHLEVTDSVGQITIYDIVESPGKAWVHRTLTGSLKLLLHGEPPKGKAFTVECIYLFTLVGHLGFHKIKAITDFVDAGAFKEMNGGN